MQLAISLHPHPFRCHNDGDGLEREFVNGEEEAVGKVSRMHPSHETARKLSVVGVFPIRAFPSVRWSPTVNMLTFS